MAVRMVTIKRSRSGLWTARKVIPADVRKAYGKREEKPTWPATLTLAQAKAEYGVWLAEVEDRIAKFRSTGTGPLVDLSERQTRALAGVWYHEALERFSENPGDVEGWDAALEAVCPPENEDLWLATQRGDPRPYDGPWVETPFLAVECDRLLERENIQITPAASGRLLQEMAGLYVRLCNVMRDRAEGDFRPDEGLKALPAWTRPAATNGARKPDANGPSILDLFDGYVESVEPAASTIKAWRRMMNHLIGYLGHDDSARVTVDDIIGWTDHLFATPTSRGTRRSAKTVRESYLSAAKAVFGWAKEKRKVDVNPTDGVRVRGPKKQKLRSSGLTDAEARTILLGTVEPQASRISPRHALARRWVPWLCAYTGARVNEMTQLRKCDVLKEDGIWAVRITPEAGGVKNNAARVVPLHSHLIDLGFLEAVSAAQDGPLFYDPDAYRGGSEGNPQYKKVGERLASWVRSLGVTGDVAPNHGWRHRFKTEGRAAEIDSKALDVIQGHAAATEGDNYGDWKMARLKKEIERLPRIDLSEPCLGAN